MFLLDSGDDANRGQLKNIRGEVEWRDIEP